MDGIPPGGRQCLTNRPNIQQNDYAIPQGLKACSFRGFFGTTEACPFKTASLSAACEVVPWDKTIRILIRQTLPKARL